MPTQHTETEKSRNHKTKGFFIVIELDNAYSGFGIDFFKPYIYGIRLGFFAIHIVFRAFGLMNLIPNK